MSPTSRPRVRGDLPTEVPAYAWSHVERTFSEYRLSAYNAPGGAAARAPSVPNPPGTFPATGWETDQPGNKSPSARIATCVRAGARRQRPVRPVRPEDSLEHTNTWMPCHAMTGGNVWMTSILASIAPDNPQPDPATCSAGGPRCGPYLDLLQGTWQTLMPGQLSAGLHPPSISGALELAASRIRGVLRNAASITDLRYDSGTGTLTFRIQNHTGHKLISGFPEGRRMFVNVVSRNGDRCSRGEPVRLRRWHVAGLPGSSAARRSRRTRPMPIRSSMRSQRARSPARKRPSTSRWRRPFKDNRIPPKGFDIAGPERSASRSRTAIRPDYFTTAEYAGGYDEVTLPSRQARRVAVGLFYQTTSREYIEFLRDEIKARDV